MGHIDYLTYAIRGLLNRQLRSYLTILGIVIGIAAIVSIVSIGQGLNEYIQHQLMQFGTDYIAIYPGKLESYMSGGVTTVVKATLTDDDLRAIESVGGVQKAYGQISEQVAVEFAGQTGTALVVGSSAGIFDTFPIYTLREGRFYRANSGEAVVGAEFADSVFKKKVRLGDTIKIGNKSFRVVGILEKGSGIAAAADYLVFTDVGDLTYALGRAKMVTAYEEIDAKLEPDSNADEVGKAIEEKLRNLHHVTEETQDFSVFTPSQFSSIIGDIIGTLNLFLGGLAGIALVVGGVGIMNTMFMSVTERTREIGVLKAIGARDRDIMEIFLIESGLIGLVGGIIGCLFGLILSFAANYFGVPSKVDLPLVSYAITFSFIVGAISGFLPAKRAAGMEPVEALRYE